MAIQIRGSGSNGVATSSTTNTVTASASPQSGDVILLFYEQDPASSGAYGTLSTTDTMGTAKAQCSHADWSQLTMWGKISDGTEGTGFTVTSTVSQADTVATVLILYDDASGTLSFGTGQTTVDASSGGTWGYPAVTTTSADSWVVIGVGGGGNVSHGTAAIFSGWGGFTEQIDLAINGAWSAIGVGTQYVATASTVAAGTITSVTLDVSLGVGIEIIRTAGGGSPTTTIVTGSAVAAVGFAETYTYTLDASPAGTVNVTPTAPVAGSWSSSPLALTSGNWNTGLTSNFTASAAGSGNIASTNDGGLTNDTLAVTVYSTSRPSAVTPNTWTDEAGGSLVVADINDASDSTGAKDPAGASYPVLAFTMDTPMAASVSQTCYFRGNNVAAGKQARQVLFANDGTTVVATGAWKTMTGSLATYSDSLTPTATAYKGEIQTQAVPADYSTSFPATESPISESSNWTNGLAVGLDWNNVQTTPGKAFGAAISGGYDDCLAVLTNTTFASDQYAEAVVYRAGGYSPGVSHEIELLIRFSITANDAHGYEVLWNVTGELNVVRWNGPLGDYTAWNGGSGPNIGAPADGDVLRAEMTGSILTVYKNASLVLTAASETTYTTGQPGIGFWPTTGATLASLGWKSFSAGNL